VPSHRNVELSNVQQKPEKTGHYLHGIVRRERFAFVAMAVAFFFLARACSHPRLRGGVPNHFSAALAFRGFLIRGNFFLRTEGVFAVKASAVAHDDVFARSRVRHFGQSAAFAVH
jgi:hypothetical protein